VRTVTGGGVVESAHVGDSSGRGAAARRAALCRGTIDEGGCSQASPCMEWREGEANKWGRSNFFRFTAEFRTAMNLSRSKR
jgi:hypothetical protein